VPALDDREAVCRIRHLRWCAAKFDREARAADLVPDARELDVAPPQRVDERLYAASVDDLVAVAQELPATARSVLITCGAPCGGS